MSRFGAISSDAEYAGKNNLAAAVAPTATDDSSAGYEVGSTWVDTTADKAYICIDATAAAAVWVETTQAAGSVTSADVSIPTDGVTTHMTNMEEAMNHFWSAASLNGFDLTDNLNGTVDIAAGDVLLRPTNTLDGQLKAYNVAATAGVVLADNDQNFIYVQYNGGSPNIAVTTDPTTLDGRTETPLYLVTRIGNALHYVDIRFYTTDYMHQNTRKDFFTAGYVHEPGGSLIADQGARTFSLSSGAFYLTDKRIPHAGFDTSVADTFTRYYTSDSGATWTRTTGQTAINQTQYNDITSGLVTLGNNKFKVAWVFLVLNDTDFLAVVEGQAEYANREDAEASTRPSILPPEVQIYSTGILVGRCILQQGPSGTEFIDVQTPFGDVLIGSSPQVVPVEDPVDSTGVLTGGVLSVGTGGPGVATTFSISDGTGKVVSNTGAITNVTWSGLTDQPLTFLATNLITFIAIDSAGAIVQSTTPFTPVQSRNNIVLGVVVHVNFTTVDTVNNEQNIAYNVMSSLYDAIEAIGFFNKSGNIFSANGANMNINKSVGVMFKMGSNYDTDVDNPHERTLAALTPAQFQYRFSDGTSGILTETNIDPNNLDDGAGGLTAISANRWSIQRIYSFTSNNVKIQRGVAEYATQSDAIAGIATEAYVTEPSIAANGLLRGWLIVKQGATALNGADALFLSAPKFGEGNAGATGAPVDLQEAYDNSTANPEILTNATGGAITIRRGSAADTDKVLQSQNGAGTETFGVTGEGKVNALDYNGVALTTGGAATNFLNAQGNYVIPPASGSLKYNRNIWMFNVATAAGYTWNGTSIAAPTAAITSTAHPHRLYNFSGTNNQHQGIYFEQQLPSSYTAGANIRVTLNTTALTATGGAVFYAGLTQPTASNVLGGTTETEWIAQTATFTGVTGNHVVALTFNFTGTNMTPGDSLLFRVYRDPNDAGDTLGTVGIISLAIEEL